MKLRPHGDRRNGDAELGRGTAVDHQRPRGLVMQALPPRITQQLAHVGQQENPAQQRAQDEHQRAVEGCSGARPAPGPVGYDRSSGNPLADRAAERGGRQPVVGHGDRGGGEPRERERRQPPEEDLMVDGAGHADRPLYRRGHVA